MGDPWVEKSQRWVNQNYGGRPGYVMAPVTGVTGWPTMYSITRALQIELGISSPSDSFGPATSAAFASQITSITAQTTRSRIIALLQCALWCKGYWAGPAFGHWDDELAPSVAQVRQDMGLSSSESVPAKVMKSLLTMDAYVRIGNGTDKVRSIQRWLNGRYWSRLDFNIIPCDGIYSRDVQRGMMLALQYELGMGDGVANGNFGNGTQQGIRSNGNLALGATDGAMKFVSLFQAALVFNGRGNTPFDGTFGPQTVSETIAFQQFVQLTPGGAANFSTWAALLVSTGDVSRAVSGADTSTPLYPATAALLHSRGYRAVGRYINGTDKRLRPDEPGILADAGLRWFPIYQEWNNEARHFSQVLGREQGERLAIRMRALGVSPNSRVYLSCDYDATNDDITALVVPHFRAASEGARAARNSVYRFGVYGTRNVCSRLAAAGITESSFVSDMSTGYSGNLGFSLPANWAYDQIQELTISDSTAAIAIDRNATSPRAESLGPADLRPTPRVIRGGVLGYDEDTYWRIAGLGYLAERVGGTAEQVWLNHIILTWLQRPTYWSDAGTTTGKIWASVYTPPIDTQWAEHAVRINTIRADFDGVAGTGIYPRPVDGLLGDLDHWAASTRGHMIWGTAEGYNALHPGDLGSWGLDLVTAWDEYEEARTAGDATDVEAWFAEHIGATSAFFGRSDLLADTGAYLVARRLIGDRPLDDVVREVLANETSNPGWMARAFVNERFGSGLAGIAVMKQAASDMFVSPWLPGWAREIFLTRRKPGTADGANPPPAQVRQTEIRAIGAGFAKAMELRMQGG